MDKLNRFAPRFAGAAAVVVVALMAASIPVKSASAENDNWRHHQRSNADWDNQHRNGGWERGDQGSFYFYSSPGYYYAPPPVYYYPPPPAYYYPPPRPYYEGPSVGFSVRIR
jgi:hypothetical protein